MNNTSKIIAGLALIASLASCSQKAEFQSSSYVRFNAEAYSVKEDAGTVRLPVYAYPKNGETSFPRAEEVYTEVSFEIVENSAKAGENFTVEPANGILTFDGESVAYITLNITNLEGEYTSDLDFTIKLTGATRDFTIGAFHTAQITIVDNDHPLAAILGSYTANVVDYWGIRYTIATTVAPVSGSTTAVTVSDLCPYSALAGYKHALSGEVSEDRSQIVIPTDQWIVQGGLIFYPLDNSFDNTDNLILYIDEENHTLTARQPWGAYSASGWLDVVLPTVVFKKQ